MPSSLGASSSIIDDSSQFLGGGEHRAEEEKHIVNVLTLRVARRNCGVLLYQSCVNFVSKLMNVVVPREAFI